MNANFRTYHKTDDYLLLEDMGPHHECLSITNDAEWVVGQVAPSLNGRRLFYIDTDGQVDELLIRDGRFAGFAPGFGGFDQLPGSPV